jgi:hypothetical protein
MTLAIASASAPRRGGSEARPRPPGREYELFPVGVPIEGIVIDTNVFVAGLQPEERFRTRLGSHRGWTLSPYLEHVDPTRNRVDPSANSASRLGEVR